MLRNCPHWDASASAHADSAAYERLPRCAYEQHTASELPGCRQDCWCNIAISNNVGGVKLVSSTPHALGEKHHFALVEVCQTNLRLAANHSCQALGPTQPSIRSQPRS